MRYWQQLGWGLMKPMRSSQIFRATNDDLTAAFHITEGDDDGRASQPRFRGSAEYKVRGMTGTCSGGVLALARSMY